MPTKRHVVSVASKIYDPIGIVSPVTIKFKLLLQDLHCAKIDWDQEVKGELLERWTELVVSIKDGEPVVVPRSYFQFSSSEADVQWRLCGFSDASLASVVYLECSVKGKQELSFVSSKTRVSPTNAQTIPRLELLGALLLARLIDNIYQALRREITLQPSVCYTDSQVALYWIKGEGRDWKPFVENRVRELVPSANWRHCPSKDNPADIPSRGMNLRDLVENSMWFRGPSWLVD